MNIYKIENWAVRYWKKDSWQAPETKEKSIEGNVYGHPNWADGSFIKTSPILNGEGRIVYTYNSIYELGEPNPEYIKHCQDSGHYVPTEEEPIRFYD